MYWFVDLGWNVIPNFHIHLDNFQIEFLKLPTELSDISLWRATQIKYLMRNYFFNKISSQKNCQHISNCLME